MMTNAQKYEVLLKQYEVLFEYSTKTAPASKNAILAFGLSAIGTILVATIALLNYGKNDVLCLISFLFVIPAACICLLFIWLGEIHRMLRAGNYVRYIEDYFNKESDEYLLSWERYIREKENRIIYSEIFVISVFLGTAGVSIFCSLFVLDYSLYLLKTERVFIFCYVLFLFLFVSGWVFYLSQRFKKYV